MTTREQNLQVTPISILNSIEKRILAIRGLNVMLDTDLAELYGVTTKRLNEQVKRNKKRFPSDFMFKLSQSEKDEVVANCDHLSRLKYSSFLPNAFTEYGAIMAATVLNTDRAIGVGIYVVRAFVKLRAFISENKALTQKLMELDNKVAEHDVSIKSLVDAINHLSTSPKRGIPRKIGFMKE